MTKEIELKSLQATIRQVSEEIERSTAFDRSRQELLERHYILLKSFFAIATAKPTKTEEIPKKTVTLGQFLAETESLNPSHDIVIESCERPWGKTTQAPIYDVFVADGKIVLTVSHEPFRLEFQIRENDSREMLYILAHRCKHVSASHKVDAAFAVIAKHLKVGMPKTPIVDAELDMPEMPPFAFGNRVSLEEPKVSVNGVPAQRTDVGTYVGDAVVHPTHYNQGNIEVWDAILDWRLDFLLGNVVKYAARAQHKGKALEDLKKAREYLNKKIAEVEKQEQGLRVADVVDRPIVTVAKASPSHGSVAWNDAPLPVHRAPPSPGEWICEFLQDRKLKPSDLPGVGTNWMDVIAGRQALRESVECSALAGFFGTSIDFWVNVRDQFNAWLKTQGKHELGSPLQFFDFFCQEHGLELEFHERSEGGTLPPYWVNFRPHVEIMNNGLLESVSGDGFTKDNATRALAVNIMGKRLVTGAYTPERREIQVPERWGT